MGTALTGSSVASTYDSLLKITDNGAVGASLKTVTDGLGNDSALQVSTAGVKSTGTMEVTGVTTLNGLASDLPVVDGGTGAGTASGARTNLGIDLSSGSVLTSSGTNGVDQTGTAGAHLVFEIAGAPTVTLTAGTWLVIGTVRVIASGTATGIRGVFRNSTDATEFGGSASNYCTTTVSDQLAVVGVVAVASGSKVIYFKLYNSNEAGGTIIAGDTTGSASPGYITAVKLLS